MIYEALVNLLLPPIGFLLPLILGCLLVFRRPRLGRWLLILGILGLVLSSLRAVPEALQTALQDGYELRIAMPGDVDRPKAIVILGGTFRSGLPDGGIINGSQLGGLSIDRARAGAILHTQTGLPILISGGSQLTGLSVGLMMRRFMENELHIAPRWMETESETTWSNATNSAVILKREGIDTVYLVTDSWHMRRAMIAFHHAGLKVWPAPVIRTLPPDGNVAHYVPNVLAWLDTYYAVHEWVGCLVYAWRD